MLEINANQNQEQQLIFDQNEKKKQGIYIAFFRLANGIDKSVHIW